MTKYRNKIRLKKYLLNHKKVDQLIEFVLLNGYSDNIVKNIEKDGINIFVTAWEESVEWIVTHADCEEYGYDLSKRTELYLILQHTPDDQKEKFNKRIMIADELFANETVETDKPYYENQTTDKKENWWLFRQLK
jgi:hypothetical protein